MATTTTYSIKMTSNSSNIRSSPKVANNNTVGWTQKGETYTATAFQNGWYKITRTSNGKSVTGWVSQGSSKQYVQLLKTNTVSTTPTTTQAKANTAKVTTQATTTSASEQAKTETKKASTKTTVSVPSQASLSDHAIVFSADTQESITGKYSPTSDFIFKDQVSGYEYGDGVKYINEMKTSNYLQNYVDGASLSSYDNKFSDRYGDIQQALAFIRETQDIPGIKDRDEIFNKFNRYKLATPDTQATKIIPYIFFTKPPLNMVDSGGSKTAMMDGDPLWESMFADEKRNFLNLDYHYKGNQHDFNCLLSNSATSFQASDEVLKTVEHGETYTGWKMVYGRNTNESNTAGQFSISYTDDHNFNIYKMHKIWVEYINRVYRGEMPSPTAMADANIYRTFREHIYKKVLTYPCAVYYIVCAADGETILYWSKYYGVFPINTPSSVSSWTHGAAQGFPEFSINYVYSIKEDFHPITLSEFNRHSTASRIYRPIYNPDTMSSSPTFVGAPYIETQRDRSNKITFKLRFRN